MGALHDLLSGDHDRLDALLRSMLRPDGSVDAEAYGEFRAGLLRHIGIEEKVLFPELRRREGESELMRQLHRDHAALAALLVPPPTAEEIETIRRILAEHNPLEECAGGLYLRFEQVVGDELTATVARIEARPDLPLTPNADSPILRSSIEHLVREADEGRSRFTR